MKEQPGGDSDPFGAIFRTIGRLRGPEYDRPLRLFAVACCHRVWHLLSEASRRDLATVERFANGAAAEEAVNEVADADPGIVGDAAGGTGGEAAEKALWVAARALAHTPGELAEEMASLQRLLREFVGPAAGLPTAREIDP